MDIREKEKLERSDASYPDLDIPNPDDFDLEKFRIKTLAQKRENFWRRKGWQLSLISTISMVLLFIAAYFLYVFLAGILEYLINFGGLSP